MSTNGHATARMWELDALAAAIRTDTMKTLADIGHEHRSQHELIVDGGHDRRRRDGNPGRRESVRHNGAHGRR